MRLLCFFAARNSGGKSEGSSRSEQLVDHLARHIGQPVTATEMFEYKFFMVETELVQNGSVKIVNMHRVFGNVITELICFSIDDTRLTPFSRESFRRAEYASFSCIIKAGINMAIWWVRCHCRRKMWIGRLPPWSWI